MKDDTLQKVLAYIAAAGTIATTIAQVVNELGKQGK